MKTTTIGAITALMLCGASASAFASPVFVGDFETGNMGQYQTLDMQSSDRLMVVTDPVRQGQYSVKATVQPGDYIKMGARAEYVITNPMFREGEERWFHWYTMFPSDFQTSPKWHLFTQWHSGEFGVPLGFNLHGEQMSFRVMGTEYDKRQDWAGGYLWKAPLERGNWMEFLLRVKFSADPNVGFVELWKDGQKVVTQTMHQTLYPGGSVYVKQGLYRDRSIDWTQSLYHDGMTVYSQRPEHLFNPPATTTPPAQPPQSPPPVAANPIELGDSYSIVLPGTPPVAAPESPLDSPLPEVEGGLGTGGAGCGASSVASALFPLAALVSIPLFRRRRRRSE